MMKNKSDSLKIEENKRISPYGKYYILVKTIDTLRCEKDELLLAGAPLMIGAIFETCPRYFDKKHIERWPYNTLLSVNAYTIRHSIYSFDISIYFPSFTTLNILNNKSFIKLLLGDKEIYDVLVQLLDVYSVNNALPVIPGNPPTSAFEGFLKRQIVDTETRLKLRMDYPIVFEDIEEAQNVEIREQALKKFGYENYVKKGIATNRVMSVVFNGDKFCSSPAFGIDYNNEFQKAVISRQDEEQLIFLLNEITFLKVRDSSTNKTYFLKVPPTMHSIQEAKAWTFGLEKGEYHPDIET